MRLLKCILYDMKFQYRHKFYFAYLFVTILYIFLMKFIPIELNKDATALIIFSDPSVLGAFFIGAIFILEKSQNTLEGLFITPLKIYEYILSKVLSLTIISFISSFLIASFSYQGSINYFYLFIGVVFTSIFYTLLGFIIALYSKSTNHISLILYY